jgi:hypothetical protein
LLVTEACVPSGDNVMRSMLPLFHEATTVLLSHIHFPVSPRLL